jgi:hypothetical protein
MMPFHPITEAASTVDAAPAVTAAHEAAQALTEALLPVTRSLPANRVPAAAYAGDSTRTFALAQTRSCVASCYEAAAQVLALQHLWDEQHVPVLASLRPVVTATSLTTFTARDAWRHAVQALGFGSSYGNAALASLRLLEESPGGLLRVLAAAEDLAACLQAVEPFLDTGVPPDEIVLPVAEPAETRPAPVPVPVTAGRRLPRWGPAA